MQLRQNGHITDTDVALAHTASATALSRSASSQAADAVMDRGFIASVNDSIPVSLISVPEFCFSCRVLLGLVEHYSFISLFGPTLSRTLASRCASSGVERVTNSCKNR